MGGGWPSPTHPFWEILQFTPEYKSGSVILGDVHLGYCSMEHSRIVSPPDEAGLSFNNRL